MKLCYALRKGFTPQLYLDPQTKGGNHNPYNLSKIGG